MADTASSSSSSISITPTPADPVVKMITIKFNVDTPIHLDTAVRGHCGKTFYRPYKGANKKQHGKMEAYIPAGTVLHFPDYVGSGFAEVVTE